MGASNGVSERACISHMMTMKLDGGDDTLNINFKEADGVNILKCEYMFR